MPWRAVWSVAWKVLVAAYAIYDVGGAPGAADGWKDFFQPLGIERVLGTVLLLVIAVSLVPSHVRQKAWVPIRDHLGIKSSTETPVARVKDELVNIIRDGERVAGDLVTGDPAWDEVVYWTRAAANFIGAVLGTAIKDRLDRVNTASNNRELILARVEAVRGILDRLEPGQIQIGPQELSDEITRRREAPKGTEDWLAKELQEAERQPFTIPAASSEAVEKRRRAAMRDLLGRSLRVGERLAINQPGPPYREGWRIHTRALVEDGYGAADAAWVFTVNAKFADVLTNLRELVRGSADREVRAGFDPTRFREFDPQGFEEAYSRPAKDVDDKHWECPYCGTQQVKNHLHCWECKAYQIGDRVFPAEQTYVHPGPLPIRKAQP